jgi:hypothetical protein
MIYSPNHACPRKNHGRGLQPIVAFSLDDRLYSGAIRKVDRVALNPETAEIVIYG